MTECSASPTFKKGKSYDQNTFGFESEMCLEDVLLFCAEHTLGPKTPRIPGNPGSPVSP